MTVHVYEDEYQPGWLCKAWLPPTKELHVPCRRPRGHVGEHQNKGKGWKWWHYPEEGNVRAIRI